jgi:hypothetical protein
MCHWWSYRGPKQLISLTKRGLETRSKNEEDRRQDSCKDWGLGEIGEEK